MKKLGLFFLLLSMILSNGCRDDGSSSKNERPNIILIMSDDMGYSDMEHLVGRFTLILLYILASMGLYYTKM